MCCQISCSWASFIEGALRPLIEIDQTLNSTGSSKIPMVEFAFLWDTIISLLIVSVYHRKQLLSYFEKRGRFGIFELTQLLLWLGKVSLLILKIFEFFL